MSEQRCAGPHPKGHGQCGKVLGVWIGGSLYIRCPKCGRDTPVVFEPALDRQPLAVVR